MGKSPGSGPSSADSWRVWTHRIRAACTGDWARVVIAASIVAAIMSISGGFGAHGASVGFRLLYGESLALTGVGLGYCGSRLLIPRPWFETRPILAAALMTLVVGLPMTLVASAAISWMARAPLDASILSDVFTTTLATTAGVVVLAFLVQARRVVETHPSARGGPSARFLSRLPSKLAGSTLRAVQSEDHYLRLYTSRGEGLILMRLADAVVELEGIEGARTHRSWWVARAAVESVERSDGKVTLTLVDGVKAPISRAYVKALREAGWL